jgi:hypothetical protein
MPHPSGNLLVVVQEVIRLFTFCEAGNRFFPSLRDELDLTSVSKRTIRQSKMLGNFFVMYDFQQRGQRKSFGADAFYKYSIEHARLETPTTLLERVSLMDTDRSNIKQVVRDIKPYYSSNLMNFAFFRSAMGPFGSQNSRSNGSRYSFAVYPYPVYSKKNP